MNTVDLKSIYISADGSHHLMNNKPLYTRRFIKVLKYHPPGFAPVIDENGAYHVDIAGNELYSTRYINTFGYYQNYAAVESLSGWFHIDIHGKPLYNKRYAWCGNFQENACVVKDDNNAYFHIDLKGRRLYAQNYRYCGDFHEYYAVVCNEMGMHTHIDCEGNSLHGKWFLGLNVFHKGHACAKDATGWFHINKHGDALYQNRFRTLGPFYNHHAHAENDNGDAIIIDQNGHSVSIIAKPYKHDNTLHALSADFVGFWKTQTIYAAVQIGILDYLPERIDIIAQKLNMDKELCQRLLRGLQELSIAECSNSIWQLTPKGQLLVPSQASAMVAAAKIWSESHYRQWLNLVDCLKGNNSSQQNYFINLAKSPSELRNYHRALGIYAVHDYQAFLENNDWQKHKVVIDAGGGAGILLQHLLAVAPHLHGVLIDLPAVINLNHDQRHPHIKYISADLFSNWPVTADAIIFARVLHDWDDTQAQHLLAQAKNHLTRNGRIYILEMVLSETTAEGSLLDLNMLVMTGGKERTHENWRTLAKSVGLRIIEIQKYSRVVNALILEKVLDEYAGVN